ncbi:MAG: hypothetical protein PHW04_17485 [Candidatus Wallbacteria bacterium]|nr:hypothetical protein [Candidatus Wallbacteria bacterium]
MTALIVAMLSYTSLFYDVYSLFSDALDKTSEFIPFAKQITAYIIFFVKTYFSILLMVLCQAIVTVCYHDIGGTDHSRKF